MRAAIRLGAGLLMLSTQATAGEQARDYVTFAASFEADCVMLEGEMRQLVNQHPRRAVEAYVYRYMGDVQQPGRRVETLPPGGEPVNLGCTRIYGGLSQHWDIGKVKFVR